jgi:hypothetical protein
MTMATAWKSESNKQEAEYGICLECGQLLSRGMLYQWTLRKTFGLHESGTGHKKFEVTMFAGRGDCAEREQNKAREDSVMAISGHNPPLK